MNIRFVGITLCLLALLSVGIQVRHFSMEMAVLAQTKSDPVRYNAIWIKTTEDRTAVWGWARKDVDKKQSELSSQGYRLWSINAFVLPGIDGERYNAIWRKDQGDRTAVWGWTFSDFNAKNTQLRNQGYQLIDVNGFVLNVNQGARYNGIWEKTDREYQSVWGWARKDFDAKQAEMKSKGYFLYRLNALVLAGNEGERYNAIWVKDKRRLALSDSAVWGYARGDFDQPMAALQSKGDRLLDLNTFVLHQEQGGRFNAVGWATGRPSDSIGKWGLTMNGLSQKNVEMESQGYKLATVNGYVLWHKPVTIVIPKNTSPPPPPPPPVVAPSPESATVTLITADEHGKPKASFRRGESVYVKYVNNLPNSVYFTNGLYAGADMSIWRKTGENRVKVKSGVALFDDDGVRTCTEFKSKRAGRDRWFLNGNSVTPGTYYFRLDFNLNPNQCQDKSNRAATVKKVYSDSFEIK